MEPGNISAEAFRKGDLSGVCRGVAPEMLLEEAASFDRGAVRICKQGSKLTAALSERCFIKCYFYAGFPSRFRHLFRLSRVKVCYAAAAAVAGAGVSTPEVFGYLRERRGGLPVRDILFTARLPESTVFMPELLRVAPEQTVRRTVLSVAALHERGIEHGDLSLRNIYVDPAERAGVIDLDSCRLRRAPLSRALRIREMARLISSAAALTADLSPGEFRELFLDCYREACGADLNSRELDARIAALRNHRQRL